MHSGIGWGIVNSGLMCQCLAYLLIKFSVKCLKSPCLYNSVDIDTFCKFTEEGAGRDKNAPRSTNLFPEWPQHPGSGRIEGQELCRAH